LSPELITRVGYRWQNIGLCPEKNISHNSHSRDFVSQPTESYAADC
jgi:hypothetical protein